MRIVKGACRRSEHGAGGPCFADRERQGKQKVNKAKERYLAERVKKAIEKWQTVLSLERWEIEFYFLPASEMINCQAKIKKRDYVYFWALIAINEDALDEDLNLIICHELLHLLVGEITAQTELFLERITKQELRIVRDAEEGVVTHLARILTILLDEEKEVGYEGK